MTFGEWESSIGRLVKVRLPIRDKRQFFIAPCSFKLFGDHEKKTVNTFYIHLHYNFCRTSRITKRTLRLVGLLRCPLPVCIKE